MSGGSQEITLSASSELICEYLEIAMNAILFQRGVFAPKTFKLREFYGLDMYMLNTVEGSQLKQKLQSLKGAITRGAVTKIRLQLYSERTRKCLEIWNFKIIPRKGISLDGVAKTRLPRKQMKVVKMEIGDVLRQILASVSVLPRLDEKTFFQTILSHDGSLRSSNTISMKSCGDDDVIQNARKMQFRSFDTGYHQVRTSVLYKELSSSESFC